MTTLPVYLSTKSPSGFGWEDEDYVTRFDHCRQQELWLSWLIDVRGATPHLNDLITYWRQEASDAASVLHRDEAHVFGSRSSAIASEFQS